MVDRVGQQLGNYRLTRLIGRGGFAEVYLGEHLRLRTLAAIKVLNSQLGDANVEDFLTEARTIAHLVHPHIIRIFDFDVQDGTPFLVMDYAPNGTLRKRHPQGIPIPLTTIVGYVKHVIDALQYAHDQKLIHRDIKPENMLIGRYDEILLSDFGIALIAQSSHLQSTQEVAGTAHYMAPEQLKGKPRLASDQYSLGVVVYEWLTGTRPFKGTFSEIASQHMYVHPPSLREKVLDISPEIEHVVLTALAKNPHQRFASVSAFGTALEQASQPIQPSLSSLKVAPDQPPELSNQSSPISIPLEYSDSVTPVSLPIELVTPPNQTALQSVAGTSPTSLSQLSTPLTPPESFLRQSLLANQPFQEKSQSVKRGISRRNITAGLAGTVLIVLMGGGITWLALSGKPPTLSGKPPIGTTLYTYKGHIAAVNAVAWSPDGKYITSGSADATVKVWNTATGQISSTYIVHTAAVNAVAWSPDGKHIASGSSDTTIQIWDTATEQLSSTYFGFKTDFNTSVNAVAWSPDGKHIASGSDGIKVWDATTGQLSLTTGDYSRTVLAVAWSPDGRRIASGSSDATIQIWDTATGQLSSTYFGHSGTVFYSISWSSDNQHIALGSYNNKIQILDTATGQLSSTYTGHSGTVFAVSWSPDGKHIASGSADATVKVWDTTTGQLSSTYTGHSGPVNAVAWSSDSQYIASGSYDKTVKEWQP